MPVFTRIDATILSTGLDETRVSDRLVIPPEPPMTIDCPQISASRVGLSVSGCTDYEEVSVETVVHYFARADLRLRRISEFDESGCFDRFYLVDECAAAYALNGRIGAPSLAALLADWCAMVGYFSDQRARAQDVVRRALALDDADRGAFMAWILSKGASRADGAWHQKVGLTGWPWRPRYGGSDLTCVPMSMQEGIALARFDPHRPDRYFAALADLMNDAERLHLGAVVDGATARPRDLCRI